MRAQPGADGAHQRAANAGGATKTQLANEFDCVFAKATEQRLQAAGDDGAQPQGPMRLRDHPQLSIAVAQPRQQGTDERDVGRGAIFPGAKAGVVKRRQCEAAARAATHLHARHGSFCDRHLAGQKLTPQTHLAHVTEADASLSGTGRPAQGIQANPIGTFRREQVGAKRIARLSHVIGFRTRTDPLGGSTRGDAAGVPVAGRKRF